MTIRPNYGCGCVDVVVKLFPSDIIIQLTAAETVDVSIDRALETITCAVLVEMSDDAADMNDVTLRLKTVCKKKMKMN